MNIGVPISLRYGLVWVYAQEWDCWIMAYSLVWVYTQEWDCWIMLITL